MNLKKQLEIFYPSDQKDDFYSVMGPHFASLEHKKELGGWQVYNMPGSIWFLLFEKKELVAFCAFFEKKGYYYLDNFIVLKEHRGKNLSYLLLQNSLKELENQGILNLKTMTNNMVMKKVFEKVGFNQTGNKGSYMIYEKINSIKNETIV